MATERLAAWLDSYRAGLREGLHTAAAQGYPLVQAGAVRGELNARDFADSARRHLRKYLQDIGLRMDALAANFPGPGLADAAHADQRVQQFKQMLGLCRDLRVPHAVVTLSGFDDPRTAPLAEQLLGVVAELAEAHGIDTLVADPAQQPDELARRLRALGCPSLHLALDTAHIPAAGAAAPVADLVGTVHLRDVRRGAAGFEEVPFGQGEVDFAGLLAQLGSADRPPSLVVRHDAEGGVDALRQGREYMGEVIGRYGMR